MVATALLRKTGEQALLAENVLGWGLQAWKKLSLQRAFCADRSQHIASGGRQPAPLQNIALLVYDAPLSSSKKVEKPLSYDDYYQHEPLRCRSRAELREKGGRPFGLARCLERIIARKTEGAV